MRVFVAALIELLEEKSLLKKEGILANVAQMRGKKGPS